MNHPRIPLPRIACAMLAMLAAAGTSQAQTTDTHKAANTTALNAAGSWVEGLPDINTRAVWDNRLEAANTSNMGGSWSALGLLISNAGGAVTINGVDSNHTLTLGSEGIVVEGANLSFSGSGTIDLAENQTWAISNGRTLTLNHGWGIMTGDADLAIAGPGSLVLGSGNGSRSYTFGSGTLSLGGGLRLINDATDLHTRTRTIANAVHLSGNIVLQSNAGGTGNGASAFIFSGGLNTGSASRVITLSLPSFTDTTTYGVAHVSRTVLDLSTANALTGTGSVYFQNESTDANKATHVRVLNIANAIAVPDIRVGANVYLTMQGTAADIGSGTAITVDTDGVFALQNATSGAGTRTIKSLSGSGTVTNFGTNALASTMVIDGGADTGRTQFSGVIRESGAGTTGVTKKGASTQVLSGANTYLGATTVDGGTLLVKGSHIQSASGLMYTVNTGGTLGGTGRIALLRSSGNNSMVTVNSGGILAAGDGNTPGTLTLDGQHLTGTGSNVHLRMQTDSRFHFDLAGDGSGSDRIDFWSYAAGKIALNNNVVNLSLVGPQVAGTYTVDLFRFYSDSGSTFSSAGVASGLILGSLTGTGIESADLIYNAAGGLVQLQYTVAGQIPEPAAWSILLGGIVLSMAATRRRR